MKLISYNWMYTRFTSDLTEIQLLSHCTDITSTTPPRTVLSTSKLSHLQVLHHFQIRSWPLKLSRFPNIALAKSGLSLIKIPMHINKQRTSQVTLAKSWLAAQQSTDELVPEGLQYPAVMVSHCVKTKRRRHHDTHKNLKCKRQVR